MATSETLFRCHALGKLMTEPKSKSETLSVGAKTHLRELAAQAIFGVDFEVSSKYTEKGLLVESESLALLNRIRGLSLAKNTERRSNEWITGECDLFDAERRAGHDLKSSWSFATFPITIEGCFDKLYEWQMRGYMSLWDADQWEVNYCLVNTPAHLIGYEPATMHFVDHIPGHMRVTTWTVKRDAALEKAMSEKVNAARVYLADVIAEFDELHQADPSATDTALTRKLEASLAVA